MSSDHPVQAIIQGAMDEEVAPYLARAARDLGAGTTDLPSHTVGRATLWPVTIDGLSLVIVRSGIGLVNAAMAATIGLREFDSPLIVSTGSAGGLGGAVHVGNVVVGASTVFSAADARAFGYALGQVPGMPATYPGDAGLLDAAQRVEGSPVVVGHVASSDVFVDAERLPGLRRDFPDAVAVDMESAAIAQVAYSLGARFLTVRGISDLCGPDAGTEHPTTVEAVSEAAARVVLGTVASVAGHKH